MAAVADGIEDRKRILADARVRAALTALDLIRYPRATGGLDNVATVLADLAEKIDGHQLGALSAAAERPVVQRLSYLLDRLGHGECAAAMHSAAKEDSAFRWTELDSKEAADPDLAPPIQEHNERWRVIVRRVPELDE